MAVEILYDRTKQIACMFCNTEGRAFGPLFDDEGLAESFIEWLRENPPSWPVASTQYARTNPMDPRSYAPSELARLVDHWRSLQTYVGDA